MGQPDGDGDGVSREEWIRGRIAEIRRNFDADAAELGALVAELEALGLSPQERRRRFRVIPGGLLVGAIAVARWARRRPHVVAGAMVGAGVGAVVAGAVLSHGAPPVRHGATGPIPGPSVTASAPVRPGASPSPTTRPRRSMPPLVPVPIVTARGRRSAGPGSPSTPAVPTPTRAGPTGSGGAPSPSATPTPKPLPVLVCPPGLVLVMLGIGVYVCV